LWICLHLASWFLDTTMGNFVHHSYLDPFTLLNWWGRKVINGNFQCFVFLGWPYVVSTTNKGHAWLQFATKYISIIFYAALLVGFEWGNLFRVSSSIRDRVWVVAARLSSSSWIKTIQRCYYCT
jgi:hypothetical protein